LVECQFWELDVAGSNPVAPTIFLPFKAFLRLFPLTVTVKMGEFRADLGLTSNHKPTTMLLVLAAKGKGFGS
jgi:hypothetical protein